MRFGVACSAKGNQVLLRIVAGVAPKFFVVNLKIGHRAARLASPAIASEHQAPKLFIQIGIEP